MPVSFQIPSRPLPRISGQSSARMPTPATVRKAAIQATPLLILMMSRILLKLIPILSGRPQGAAESAGAQERFPRAAGLDAQIEGRPYRRGVGNLFASSKPARRLEPMPKKPTLLDFFQLRFQPANHVLQSATRAMKTGMTEEVILACLLHDVVQALIKVDHGWW